MKLLAEQISLVLSHVQILERSKTIAEKLTANEEMLQGHDDELLRRSEEIFSQDLELIKKDERLKKAEKLKQDFLEKMARELRSPLNQMIEHIISVLSNEEENLAPESTEHLRAALGEGTGFSRTLNNIVELWRIKEGKVPVDSRQIQLETVVDEAIHHVQQVAIERRVKIEKDLQRVEKPIRTDLVKLTQVFAEVIGNAVKFTSKGTVRVSAHTDGNETVCRIEDTGIGIALDDLPHIFETFYQVDESGTSGFHGAGLGLAVAQQLLGLMNSTIEVTSVVGTGTTVKIVLRQPLSENPVEPRAQG
jgi:signal transduction histidine kinase